MKSSSDKLQFKQQNILNIPELNESHFKLQSDTTSNFTPLISNDTEMNFQDLTQSVFQQFQPPQLFTQSAPSSKQGFQKPVTQLIKPKINFQKQRKSSFQGLPNINFKQNFQQELLEFNEADEDDYSKSNLSQSQKSLNIAQDRFMVQTSKKQTKSKKNNSQYSQSYQPNSPTQQDDLEDENTRSSRGLKKLSSKVQLIVESQKKTSYKNVAELLIKDIEQNKNQQTGGVVDTKEEQNVKRRVYDALNVLIAAGVIKKEGKMIYCENPDGKSRLERLRKIQNKKQIKSNLETQRLKWNLAKLKIEHLSDKLIAVNNLRIRNSLYEKIYINNDIEQNNQDKEKNNNLEQQEKEEICKQEEQSQENITLKKEEKQNLEKQPQNTEKIDIAKEQLEQENKNNDKIDKNQENQEQIIENNQTPDNNLTQVEIYQQENQQSQIEQELTQKLSQEDKEKEQDKKQEQNQNLSQNDLSIKEQKADILLKKRKIQFPFICLSLNKNQGDIDYCQEQDQENKKKIKIASKNKISITGDIDTLITLKLEKFQFTNEELEQCHKNYKQNQLIPEKVTNLLEQIKITSQKYNLTQSLHQHFIIQSKPINKDKDNTMQLELSQQNNLNNSQSSNNDNSESDKDDEEDEILTQKQKIEQNQNQKKEKQDQEQEQNIKNLVNLKKIKGLPKKKNNQPKNDTENNVEPTINKEQKPKIQENQEEIQKQFQENQQENQEKSENLDDEDQDNYLKCEEENLEEIEMESSENKQFLQQKNKQIQQLEECNESD